MSVSLLGIIAVQVLWIRNAIQIEERTLNTNVNKVLHSVVNKLEKEETVLLFGENIDALHTSINGNIEIEEIKHFIKEKHQEGKHEIHIKSKQVIGDKHTKVINTDSQFVFSIKDSSDKSIKVWHSNHDLAANVKLDLHQFKQDTLIRKRFKRKQIENISEQIVVEFNDKDKNILERIDTNQLPLQLKSGLKNFGIDTSFNYAILNSKNQNVLVTSDSSLNKSLIKSGYQVSLFPNDIFEKHTKLALTFPNRFKLVYKSILPLLILSAIFTLFIIITFSNAVYLILKQKRISDIKSDFINNITHEFKTPIATIGLASDSINNPKVIGSPDRIRYFTNIIKDENFRMNKQVENILQLSLFGKHELEINPQSCRLNELISKAADHIQLQIEEKNGKITTDLNAANDIANVDEVHFLNVLFNLFDNAIKYTDGSPNIEINTINKDQHIYIAIKDSGIGMSSQTQKKVFKKFYRAQSGNIHKVKGFGLGLSYVKLIIDRHKGKIDIQSKPGEGTNIEIRLPLQNFSN
jgi:two-component system phosphate regulon sensor histidine kinase PhoR